MLDKLFDNIGERIKCFAKYSFVIEVICSVIIGIGEIIKEDDKIIETVFFTLCAIAGAYVLSIFLYGFGHLIENTEQNRKINQSIYDKLNKKAEADRDNKKEVKRIETKELEKENKAKVNECVSAFEESENKPKGEKAEVNKKDEVLLKKALIKTLNYSTVQGMRSNLNYIKNSVTKETEKHLIDSILEADDSNLAEKIEEVINSL